MKTNKNLPVGLHAVVVLLRHVRPHIVLCGSICFAGCVARVKTTEYSVDASESNAARVRSCVSSVASHFRFEEKLPLAERHKRLFYYEVHPSKNATSFIAARIDYPLPALSVPGDFKNFSMLIGKLQGSNKSDKVSQFLRSRLSEELLAELTKHNAKDDFKVSLALAREINASVIDIAECIYQPERFDSVKLSPETANLLQKHPSRGLELFRLNRLLLDDAYPEELVRSGGQQLFVMLHHWYLRGQLSPLQLEAGAALQRCLRDEFSGRLKISENEGIVK